MRVIAGTRRSLKLSAPEGLDTRPTQDRIKETLFNVIQSEVPGSVFLDLFSGTGAIAIEALSRGAKTAYLVENNKKAAECILKNLSVTKLREEAVLLRQDVFSALTSCIRERADIIFMDPPYGQEYERKVLELLAASDHIADTDTLIIFEASLDTNTDYLPLLGYDMIKQKRYKTNQHIFLKKRENA